MRAKKSFTLAEVLVVLIIVAILAALALPNFGAVKEKSLDREAKASLALIQAAEKIYKMETAVYYSSSGANTADRHTNINTYLKKTEKF